VAVSSEAGDASRVSDPLPSSAEVIVIDAGHSGLVAAGYLAKAGVQVAVVEAADAPGGMTASGPLIMRAGRCAATAALAAPCVMKCCPALAITTCT